MSNKDKIARFYDDFSKDHLLNDYNKINLRHKALKTFCKSFIRPHFFILEAGCGVGGITGFLSSISKKITAADISPLNIETAKQFVKASNVEFLVSDFFDLTFNHQIEFDAILFLDVLEHIPPEKRSQLWSKTRDLLKPNGIILLSFPSPEFQNYLQKNHKEKLQIIDECIEIDELLQESKMKLKYFNYVDVFEKNQYIHVVLSKNIEYTAEKTDRNLYERFLYKIENFLWRQKNKDKLKKVKSVSQKNTQC